MLLAHLLEGRIQSGRLTIIDAGGMKHVFGSANATPDSTIRLHDKALHYKLFMNPSLYFGEAYVDGTMTIEDGTLSDFLRVGIENFPAIRNHPLQSMIANLVYPIRALQQFNSVARARKNVAPHYDTSDGFAELFLDPDLQYTCAYFVSPEQTLEEAQEAKKRHIAAKLLLEPGQRVIELGSGWGGLALYLARIADIDVTAVTLSPKQNETALQRAAAAGLSDRVHFLCGDYREQEGQYDRVVAIGLMEHVGVRYYPKFFNKIGELLADDGVALIHAIGRGDGPGTTTPWLRKYIFPGGYLPALSEVLPAVEQCGLFVTDIEILRLHYAETLKEWLRRFSANREAVARLYDERFCRMWEFYLASCEMSFRYWNQMVFQIQLAKSLGAVPLTRDYIGEWEQAHGADAESA